MTWKCLIFLLIFINCVTPENPNNNSSKNVEITRIKRGGGDYEYQDYGGAAEIPKSKILLFTSVLWTSVVLIVVQTLVSIYGPHLPDHPLRWHTLNYSCWNCFQLMVFANCVEESEFKKFLYNNYLTDNCESIQKMTLTVYYQSMFAVAPVEILMYFVPESKTWPITKYYFWIPFIAALDFGEPWGWWVNGYAPIDTYQACITALTFAFVVVLLIITICLIVKYVYYYCQYNARPDARLWKHFTYLLNFILFFVYFLVVTVIHSPKNGVGMGLWFAPMIYKWILPYADILLETFLPFATSVMELQELFVLFIPTAEFFATFICLKIYRQQLLQCLSCGQLTHRSRRLTQNALPSDIEKKVEKLP